MTATLVCKVSGMCFFRRTATIGMRALAHRRFGYRRFFEHHFRPADGGTEKHAQANAQQSRGNDPAHHCVAII